MGSKTSILLHTPKSLMKLQMFEQIPNKRFKDSDDFDRYIDESLIQLPNFVSITDKEPRR